ncbi:MAG: tRNA guanosine(34) transglycosylase Tgt, partial [Pseudomonadota bacterium]
RVARVSRFALRYKLGEAHCGRLCDLVLERYAPGRAQARARRDLVGAVERGIDMFDCVLPTRSGRNGQAFTWNGPINLRNARFAEDKEPLDPNSDCPASRDYSKAYLHHLQKSGEILGAMLVTEHNLAFYQQLMRAMGVAIAEGRFADFARDFRRDYLKPKG